MTVVILMGRVADPDPTSFVAGEGAESSTAQVLYFFSLMVTCAAPSRLCDGGMICIGTAQFYFLP